MFHHLLHKLGHDVFPPALMALGTSLLAWASGVNWIGVGGLCVSAGWLTLGYFRHRLDRDRFEHERANRPA